MKKIIFSIFAISLIALCCSMSLNAQSSEKDLDQVELMKQFIGSWTAESGVDTTVFWEIFPSVKGYEHNGEWKAKGETYAVFKGIIGFSGKFRTVEMYTLWNNGTLSRDIGGFVSDKKLIFKRFAADYKHVRSTHEVTFITPEKCKWVAKSRGMKETWDDAEIAEWIFIRVKK